MPIIYIGYSKEAAVWQRLHLHIAPEPLAGLKAVQALVGSGRGIERGVIVHDVDDLQVKSLHIASDEPQSNAQSTSQISSAIS